VLAAVWPVPRLRRTRLPAAAHAEAHKYLGVLHARRGRVAKAVEHFRAAVATKPGYRDARLNLERANRLLEDRGSGQ
jgi:Flp pilus assembly protein TadD